MAILVACITFLALDFLWIGFIANSFYQQQLGPLLRLTPAGGLDPIWSAAVIVYIALIGGLMVFVVPRAQGSLLAALGYGALFGLVTYGTYDFTNLALFQGWNWTVCLVDSLWGMTLCGLTSLATVAVSRVS